MNDQKNDRTITNDEYTELRKAIENLDSAGDLSKMATNFAMGAKVLAAGQNPQTWDAENLVDEAYREGLVINLLQVIDRLKRNHEGAFKLPGQG